MDTDLPSLIECAAVVSLPVPPCASRAGVLSPEPKPRPVEVGNRQVFLSFALLLSVATTVEVKDPSLDIFLSTNN